MAQPPPDFLIYGSPVSPFARKTMACAIEKGVPFDVEPVNIMSPPEWFPAISPMKRIPVLRDRSIAAGGDHSSAQGTIADSSAICAYIEKKHPEPALYPADAFAYGRTLFVEEYADTALAPMAGIGVFRPIFFSIAQGKEPDIQRARVAWAEELPPVLDYLEAALGEADYFAGNALSIADIAITCAFMQIELVARAPLDNWPRLKAHHARMTARASIAGPFGKAQAFIRKALPDPFDLT
ncbi:MAG: glutathione S-transferase family protein [Erythrobacter sp.]|uniref:glutathione S-transferase family protein n=1 Tax=Erythrobacter sp. TaxID=1042 RepID=UPI002621055D|nr:glutathione S-transferase family protein [Erythrobacter sp.]MDJ0979949.1 glutathione S-transferase family protein [Erythrobacter sp.]